jgi:hypothetical protein
MVIKSRRMGLTRHVARMRGFGISARKHERDPLGDLNVEMEG